MVEVIPIWWRYLYAKHFINLLRLHGITHADFKMIRDWSKVRLASTPLREAWQDVQIYMGIRHNV